MRQRNRMAEKQIILTFWDPNHLGSIALENTLKGLSAHKIKPTAIVYLICQYIYENTTIKDKPTEKYPKGRNPRERIAFLTEYYKDSSINFIPLIIPSSEFPEGSADNLKTIESAITHFVFPKIIKLNPYELHLTLTSGTQSMRFAWISLYTKSLLTRSFGENVHIWQRFSDRGKKENPTDSYELYEIEIEKNPFIDAIEKRTYTSNDISPVNLDFDGKIRRNAAIDVPMLILGERGIGKSTLIETTIVPTKKAKGYIEKTEVQTIVCGQLDSELAADELFGHAKGAFTGAVAPKQGKIQLANKGILFLDEIQDLPRPIQRKLLRALQFKKFNPIGQIEEIESDFKLVCASNNTLSELQQKLDPDFFDRIATFKSYIKPLREQDKATLQELWKNRWNHALSKGFALPLFPDSFDLVAETLMNSKMLGNIRDIEQLIAYIARDVYQGTPVIAENIKLERYKLVLKDWISDYTERYSSLKESCPQNLPPNTVHTEETLCNEDLFQEFMAENSWKDINNLFKKWLAETAIKTYGSRKEAAKALHCEEKTLYNARLEE